MFTSTNCLIIVVFLFNTETKNVEKCFECQVAFLPDKSNIICDNSSVIYCNSRHFVVGIEDVQHQKTYSCVALNGTKNGKEVSLKTCIIDDGQNGSEYYCKSLVNVIENLRCKVCSTDLCNVDVGELVIPGEYESPLDKSAEGNTLPTEFPPGLPPTVTKCYECQEAFMSDNPELTCENATVINCNSRRFVIGMQNLQEKEIYSCISIEGEKDGKHIKFLSCIIINYTHNSTNLCNSFVDIEDLKCQLCSTDLCNAQNPDKLIAKFGIGNLTLEDLLEKNYSSHNNKIPEIIPVKSPPARRLHSSGSEIFSRSMIFLLSFSLALSYRYMLNSTVKRVL